MLGGEHGRGGRKATEADHGGGLVAAEQAAGLHIAAGQPEQPGGAAVRGAGHQPARRNHIDTCRVKVTGESQTTLIRHQPQAVAARTQAAGQRQRWKDVTTGATGGQGDQAHKTLSCRGRRRVRAKKMPMEMASDSRDEPP